MPNEHKRRILCRSWWILTVSLKQWKILIRRVLRFDLFLWHLNREWIKMDGVETGETVLFFRQQIMKIGQISYIDEVVDFRIICENKLSGFDHWMWESHTGCWNGWLDRVNFIHWFRQSRERGFWGRRCLHLIHGYVCFKIHMILERKLIKLSRYLKLVILLLERKKREVKEESEAWESHTHFTLLPGLSRPLFSCFWNISGKHVFTLQRI